MPMMNGQENEAPKNFHQIDPARPLSPKILRRSNVENTLKQPLIETNNNLNVYHMEAHASKQKPFVGPKETQKSGPIQSASVAPVSDFQQSSHSCVYSTPENPDVKMSEGSGIPHESIENVFVTSTDMSQGDQEQDPTSRSASQSGHQLGFENPDEAPTEFLDKTNEVTATEKVASENEISGQIEGDRANQEEISIDKTKLECRMEPAEQKHVNPEVPQRSPSEHEPNREQSSRGKENAEEPPPESPKQKAIANKRGQKRKLEEISPNSREAHDALRARLVTAWDECKDDLKNRSVLCEIDLATVFAPYAVLHHDVRIYWPDEDAWFSGTIVSYDQSTGKHKILYDDEDEEELWLARGLERVRMLVPLQGHLKAPSPEELHTLSHTLLEQSRLEGNVGKKKALESCSKRLRVGAEAKAIRLAKLADNPIYAANEKKETENPILPGHVVWAKFKGCPTWPSLVMTHEEASANGLKGVTGNKLALQAFGDASWFAAKRSDVVTFSEGIDQNLHAKSPLKTFRRALFEVIEYLQDGRLPEAMVPDNNDEGFSSDDEEDIAWQKSRLESGIVSDIKISPSLTVNAFGRIEFLHPAFHNEKHIWPLGYKATSVRESPKSKDSEATYVCEILSASNNSGPLFRISCMGKAGESDKPQNAWQKLMLQFKKKALPSGQEGLKMFGLSHPKVLSHILGMPDANRCEQFCGWPDGAIPEFPKLTISEKRARIHAEVAMQQLPEGVSPVQNPKQTGACCEACGAEEEFEDNLMLQCDGPCKLFVHQNCCGQIGPAPSSWICSVCKTGSPVIPSCAVCPVQGGILMRTKCKRFCHAACALWIPEVIADISKTNPQTTEVDIGFIPRARKQLSCSVCKQNYGACIQCAGSTSCYSAFHVLCARSAQLPMNVDFKLQKSGLADPENGISGDVTEAPSRKKMKVDGTSMGDGSRLMCYCPKHAQMAEKKRAKSADPALLTHQTQSNPGRQLNNERQEGTETQNVLEADSFSARLHPFNHAIRRGMRAPEAVENALAKRKFLQRTPYLVGNLKSASCQNVKDLELGSFVYGSETLRSQIDYLDPSGKRKASGAKHKVPQMSQRYHHMRQTENARVAIGKSQIHGWGAISKVPHKRGEMIIEYSGETIRQSLADVRERNMYDQVVGAGTYIFKLDDDSCIDATQRGNLAHMLNHSCQPNCFSRNIQVTDSQGKTEEHVVIFAGSDIPKGTELTYNYRFCSTEELPCNCSAPNCCGLVNASGEANLGFQLVQRSELTPLQ